MEEELSRLREENKVRARRTSSYCARVPPLSKLRRYFFTRSIRPSESSSRGSPCRRQAYVRLRPRKSGALALPLLKEPYLSFFSRPLAHETRQYRNVFRFLNALHLLLGPPRPATAAALPWAASARPSRPLGCWAGPAPTSTASTQRQSSATRATSRSRSSAPPRRARTPAEAQRRCASPHSACRPAPPLRRGQPVSPRPRAQLRPRVAACALP